MSKFIPSTGNDDLNNDILSILNLSEAPDLDKRLEWLSDESQSLNDIVKQVPLSAIRIACAFAHMSEDSFNKNIEEFPEESHFVLKRVWKLTQNKLKLLADHPAIKKAANKQASTSENDASSNRVGRFNTPSEVIGFTTFLLNGGALVPVVRVFIETQGGHQLDSTMELDDLALLAQKITSALEAALDEVKEIDGKKRLTLCDENDIRLGKRIDLLDESVNTIRQLASDLGLSESGSAGDDKSTN